MAQTPAIPDNCQWGIFLRNHDELTLEMVTDEERDYMYAEYAKDPRMKANIGIRRRLAPLLENDATRSSCSPRCCSSLPGSPVLYYGDEIGMGDNIWLGDRDGVRTPMQWTPDRNAGFSTLRPGRLYLPVIMDSIYGYQVINVEAQMRNSTSLLHWTRRMIEVRKRHPGVRRWAPSPTAGGVATRACSLRPRVRRRQSCCASTTCRASRSRSSSTCAGSRDVAPVELIGGVHFPRSASCPTCSPCRATASTGSQLPAERAEDA